jgi:hypothetical protein
MREGVGELSGIVMFDVFGICNWLRSKKIEGFAIKMVYH